MFEIGATYWLKVKGDTDRLFNIKCTILEENSFMIKAEVGHGEKPSTVDIIPFSRIVDVERC